MPVFVGAGDTSSRIRSNRVGFASHSANPGTASEGDVYFNSSDGGLRAYNGSNWSAVGAGGGTFSGIASGAISNGQSVLIKTDGTIGVVTATAVGVQTTSSTSVYSNAIRFFSDVAYDSGNDRFVVFWVDNDNSNYYAYARVVAVNSANNSLTFGALTTVYAGHTRNVAIAYDESAQRVVLAYNKSGSNSGAKVGNVDPSDNSITFGSEIEVNTSHSLDDIQVVYAPDQEKTLFVYENETNYNYGMVRVGTVDPSDNSMTLGGTNTYITNAHYSMAAGYDTTNNRLLIAYRDGGNNNYGTVIAGTVSGNAVTFGTASVFASENAQPYKKGGVLHDSVNNKNVVFFRDSNENGEARVFTVNTDDNSITYSAAAVQFNNFRMGSTGAVVYNSSAGKFSIINKDEDDGSKTKLKTASIVDTAISATSAVTIDTNSTDYFAGAYNSTLRNSLLTYSDESTTDIEAFVHQIGHSYTNLTANNFLGFSDADYSDGATAKIQIVGSVDDAQTGLTTGSLHYVQMDGSLGVAASTPSVVAGIALTDTKILIRK